MQWTMFRGAVRSWTWIAGAMLMALTSQVAAQVVTPVVNPPIVVPIPPLNSSVIVNLREQGVLSSQGPLEVSFLENVVFRNGNSASGLTITTFDPVPGRFGAVCVRITNDTYDFDPNLDTLTSLLRVRDVQGNRTEYVIPERGAEIRNGQARVVDPNNSADLDACEDPVFEQPRLTIEAGVDRNVGDTDGQPGEAVPFSLQVNDPAGGDILSVSWFIGDQRVAEGRNPTIRLPDGATTLRVFAVNSSDQDATDTVTITVLAASGPTASAGADRTIEDTDRQPGEDVVLDGGASVSPNRTITNYRWTLAGQGEGEQELGAGSSPTLRTRLSDGENSVRLTVTDSAGATAVDTVFITIGAGNPITTLSDLPGLSPNQRRVAFALDRACTQLRGMNENEAALTDDQQDLLGRCDGLQINNTTENQVNALDQLVADDFAVARTQTLLFANTQYAGVNDRLIALRGGAKGLSLAGLNIIVDGRYVPLAELQDMVKGLLGGGASADEPGDLLSDKWGLWARGNYSFGDKKRSPSSPSFDADQWAMVGGVDYRFNDKTVGGLSLAYGQSSVEFSGNEGGLDTDTWAMSLYGSRYAARNLYIDGIVNIAKGDYAADRNITYVDGQGLVDVDAHGDSKGMTYSAGLSGGYDFLFHGFTLSPNAGLFYIDATIDGFTENGAGGLNLIYDEQTFQSFTGNLGIRANYAWNLAWGVLVPHLRIDYVREFKDDVDVFGVRFAADPSAASAPPILVQTDNPDASYWRLATGMSAQFVHGISGYVEYQRLVSFQFITFQDVSVGLRFQRSF